MIGKRIYTKGIKIWRICYWEKSLWRLLIASIISPRGETLNVSCWTKNIRCPQLRDKIYTIYNQLLLEKRGYDVGPVWIDGNGWVCVKEQKQARKKEVSNGSITRKVKPLERTYEKMDVRRWLFLILLLSFFFSLLSRILLFSRTQQLPVSSYSDYCPILCLTFPLAIYFEINQLLS